jgi:hypothetical protein
MSTMQATSFLFQTTCTFCNVIRDKIVHSAKMIYDGIILSKQLSANYQVAEQLAGRGDFKGMSVAEVAHFINQKTL